MYHSIAEYRERFLCSGDTMDGTSNLARYEDIEKWHLNTLLYEDIMTVPPGYSIAFEYAYVDEDEVVGMVNIRPDALNHPYLKTYGGHIGYSIRPDKRRNSLGTSMLKDALGICKKDFNLKKVLITCLKENVGSRKVIINNGGIFESELFYPPEDKYIERYWIIL